eukprot:3287692-Alexandrium_andersonii.AAC.1
MDDDVAQFYMARRDVRWLPYRCSIATAPTWQTVLEHVCPQRDKWLRCLGQPALHASVRATTVRMLGRRHE